MIASIFRPLPGETRIGTRSAVIVIIVFVIVIVDIGLDANMMLIRLVILMWSCTCFPLDLDATETIFSRLAHVCTYMMSVLEPMSCMFWNGPHCDVMFKCSRASSKVATRMSFSSAIVTTILSSISFGLVSRCPHCRCEPASVTCAPVTISTPVLSTFVGLIVALCVGFIAGLAFSRILNLGRGPVTSARGSGGPPLDRPVRSFNLG